MSAPGIPASTLPQESIVEEVVALKTRSPGVVDLVRTPVAALMALASVAAAIGAAVGIYTDPATGYARYSWDGQPGTAYSNYWIDFNRSYDNVAPSGAAHVFHMYAAMKATTLSSVGQMTLYYAHADGDPATLVAGKTMSSLIGHRGNVTWGVAGTLTAGDGGQFSARLQSDGALLGNGVATSLKGVRGFAEIETDGSGSVGELVGVWSEAVARKAATVVPTAVGFYSYVRSQAAAQGITTGYGLRLVIEDAGPGIANYYGVHSAVNAKAGHFGLYFGGTVQHYLAGPLGLGSTTMTGFGLRLALALTGATSAYAQYNNGVIQSDVTSSARYFYTNAGTAAAAFTLANLNHYEAAQGTFGAGSTVTTQTGFLVGSSLIGATNNYGFRSSIAFGTGRWNFYGDGTANNYLAGSLFIGTTASPETVVRVAKSITGSTSSHSVYASGLAQSDVTALAVGFRSSIGTAAASFTVTNLCHFYASQGSTGAGSTVTNQYGIYVNSNMVDAANNYGLFSNIPAAPGRWNFYAAGTAQNYFAGNVGIGVTTPAEALHISATAPHVRIAATTVGATAVDGTNAGLQLTAAGMDGTLKYTPGVLFGSTDPQFTTTSPKFGAGIFGCATQFYSADDAGGMALEFFTSPNTPGTGHGLTKRWSITEAGHFLPAVDNAYNFGSASFRLATVYAGTGTINTSDERTKTDIAPLGDALEVIELLEPVSFRYRQGGAAIEMREVEEEYEETVTDTVPELDGRGRPIVDVRMVERQIERKIEHREERTRQKTGKDGEPLFSETIVETPVTDEVDVLDDKGQPVFVETGGRRERLRKTVTRTERDVRREPLMETYEHRWTETVLDSDVDRVREARTRTVERKVTRTRKVMKPVAVPREGRRTHYGLVAQQVKAVMDRTGRDFGMYVYDAESDHHGLRYDQGIPLLIRGHQQLHAIIREQGQRIAELERRLAA